MLTRKRFGQRSGKRLRRWPLVLIIIILLAGGGYWAAHTWYDRNLAPVSSSQKITYFPIASGSSLQEIAEDLQNDHLIRNSTAFETYVRGRQLYSKMQAGVYALTPSMSVAQIVDKIVNGEVSKNLITILPGKTIADIRQTFKQAGYDSDEISVALNASNYTGEPMLDSLPPGESLEGFLYPDSWQKEASTPAQTIIRESLEEMRQHLTPDIVSGFRAQGLSIYQGVTLASIVYQESGNPSDEPTIAQVFLSRINQGMPLQSNVTADYASDLAGVPRSITINSPYNTYLHKGLPPGPISNMTDAALKAVAHPSKTDYLYFVNGEDCQIHYARTGAQHEANIQKYGNQTCS